MKKEYNYQSKFPKYTREENLSCKLSNEQIKEIENFYNLHSDHSEFKTDIAIYKYLAERYKVHYQTIHYWSKYQYRLKVNEYSAKVSAIKWKTNREKVLETAKKMKKRKREVKHNELKEYNYIGNTTYNKGVREFVKLHKEEFKKFMKDFKI